MISFARALLVYFIIFFASLIDQANAQKKYDFGANDGEIKIGNVMPYSGPVSAYATIGKTEAAYFNKINDEGGVDGRKINFVSYDDAFSPPKTVEQARKLVERDEVLLLFSVLGTATNTAIQRYLNEKKVPQIFVATGATKWNDPQHFPWTMGWQPNYQSEARIYAKYLLQKHSGAKVGILYQNDDYGRDYVKGLKDGLGGKIQIVSELAYEPADPTIDSQIVNLKASGADIFFNVATPKFAAQAIRKVAEIGWRPVQLLNNVATSVGAVLKPAGLKTAEGILSTAFINDPTDPSWKDDPAFKEWSSFMERYFRNGDRTDILTVYGYLSAQTLVQV
jgi:branched-chain amino acid transport system substrate-binding protein